MFLSNIHLFVIYKSLIHFFLWIINFLSMVKCSGFAILVVSSGFKNHKNMHIAIRK